MLLGGYSGFFLLAALAARDGRQEHSGEQGREERASHDPKGYLKPPAPSTTGGHRSIVQPSLLVVARPLASDESDPSEGDGDEDLLSEFLTRRVGRVSERDDVQADATDRGERYADRHEGEPLSQRPCAAAFSSRWSRDVCSAGVSSLMLVTSRRCVVLTSSGPRSVQSEELKPAPITASTDGM